MQLRYYQLDAAIAAEQALDSGQHPALQLATGTGKSLIISELAQCYKERRQRVWVLTHIQELVEQNAKAYTAYTRDVPGLYCAGLRRSDADKAVTFGTVQSMLRPALENKLSAPNLIIIDEAHRVPHKTGEAGMYEKLLQHFPQAKRLGMTATPWRMDNGLIYGEDPERFWFNTCAYTYSVAQGVADGYLAPLVGVETEVQLDLKDVDISEDYSNVQVAERETMEWLGGVATSLAHLGRLRNHIAVYCPTVVAAMRAAAAIAKVTGWSVKILTGSMSRTERLTTLSTFKTGETRVLCSVDTITTGFDLPALDCIACLRPTVSSSLWVQIQGRGTRIFEGKKNCLLLDYVGNLQRLGGVGVVDTYVRERNTEASEPIEAAPPKPKAPRKQLPGVRTLAPIDPMTGEPAQDGATLTVTVSAISAVPLVTRRNPGVPILMVRYITCTPEGAKIDASLFVDTMRNTRSAWDFFKARRLAVNLPAPAQDLIWQVRGAALPPAVTIRKSGRYWNVIDELWETAQ